MLKKNYKGSYLRKCALGSVAAFTFWVVNACNATSFVDEPALALQPDVETRVEHCEGWIYDSNTTGAVDSTDMRYRVFKPVNYDATKKYPVIMFLHGLGHEGNNNTGQVVESVLILMNKFNREHYPCFIVCPQRPGAVNNTSTQWYANHKAEVFGILTDIKDQFHYSIDLSRIYLTGISYGGFGTFAFLTNNAAGDPFHWAAGAPLSGNGGQSGAYSMANKLVGFPLWMVHAAPDGTVNVADDDDMFYNIRAQGGTPMYSRYTTGNHTPTTWNGIYGSPQFLPWLMAQRFTDETCAQRELPLQTPGVYVTGYRVGATLDIQGTSDDGAGLVGAQVGWWNPAIASGTGSPTIPAPVTTGVAVWSATGIALASGSNTICVTEKGPSLTTLGGNLYAGGRPLSIVYATPPVEDTEAPRLAVTGPSLQPVIVTSNSAVILSGTASDNGEITLVDWSSDRTVGGSGSAAGTTTWVTPPIALDRGNNMITLKAHDTAGNIAAQIVTVMYNQAPLAVTDAVTMPGNTASNINVLANDSDPDAQPQMMTITSVTSPAHGTAQVLGLRVRYVPTPGYRGSDSFNYTISDGLTQSTGRVDVTVSGTVLDTGTTYFSQDFASSTLSDYTSATPGIGQFNDLSNEIDGGQWSIDTGRLKLVRTGLSGSNNGAGFARWTDISTGSQFVKVSFDYTLSGGTSSSGVILSLVLGSLTAYTDYNKGLPNSSYQNEFSINAKGTNLINYSVSNGRWDSPSVGTDSASHNIKWYVNATGAQTRQYWGDDGCIHDVSPNQSSLWIDGVLLFDNVARPSNWSSTKLTDFRLASTVVSAITLTLDNFTIAEQVPSVGADPSVLQNWRQIHGLPSDGSQDLSAPAGDGVASLLKYALNMAPNPGDLAIPYCRPMLTSGTAGLPRTEVDGQGKLVFKFMRRKAATSPEVVYDVKASDDLAGWSSYSGTPTVESLDSIWERVSYTVDPTLSPHSFLRLEVRRP